MTVFDGILLGIILVLTVAFVMALKVASAWRYRADQLKEYWTDERENHNRTDRKLSNLQWKHDSLKREYDELAELDEGEDYVRESLGYPPDEDEGESA